MDVIMGRFADAEIERLAESELDEYERLIDVRDPDLFAWICIQGAPGHGERVRVPSRRTENFFHSLPSGESTRRSTTGSDLELRNLYCRRFRPV